MVQSFWWNVRQPFKIVSVIVKTTYYYGNANMLTNKPYHLHTMFKLWDCFYFSIFQYTFDIWGPQKYIRSNSLKLC